MERAARLDHRAQRTVIARELLPTVRMRLPTPVLTERTGKARCCAAVSLRLTPPAPRRKGPFRASARPLRLAVRTSPSHGENTSSILVGVTISRNDAGHHSGLW